MSANDAGSAIAKIPSTSFWSTAIKAEPKLETLVTAVVSGQLTGYATGGKLYLTLGNWFGIGYTNDSEHGAINMSGPPLPALPPNGSFEIKINYDSATLTIKDASGFPITEWHGIGHKSGFYNSPYYGRWVLN